MTATVRPLKHVRVKHTLRQQSTSQPPPPSGGGSLPPFEQQTRLLRSFYVVTPTPGVELFFGVLFGTTAAFGVYTVYTTFKFKSEMLATHLWPSMTGTIKKTRVEARLPSGDSPVRGIHILMDSLRDDQKDTLPSTASLATTLASAIDSEQTTQSLSRTAAIQPEFVGVITYEYQSATDPGTDELTKREDDQLWRFFHNTPSLGSDVRAAEEIIKTMFPVGSPINVYVNPEGQQDAVIFRGQPQHVESPFEWLNPLILTFSALFAFMSFRHMRNFYLLRKFARPVF